MNRVQVASYVTPEQHRRIKALAEIDRLSISAMVATLIDEAYEANFEVESDACNLTQILN